MLVKQSFSLKAIFLRPNSNSDNIVPKSTENDMKLMELEISSGQLTWAAARSSRMPLSCSWNK